MPAHDWPKSEAPPIGYSESNQRVLYGEYFIVLYKSITQREI